MPEEPQVTVRNIPQSQYQGQAPGQSSGLIGNIKQHWPVWTVAIGLVTVVVMYMMYRNSQNNAATAAQDYTGTTGTSGTGNLYPDQLWGSQLDADYQQMTSAMNTNTALLQQILNGITNPTSSSGSGSGGSGSGSGGSGSGSGSGSGGANGGNPPHQFIPTFAGLNPNGGINQLPAGTSVNYGANGRVWFTTPGGSSSLLDAPESWLEANSTNAYLPQNYIIQPGSNGGWNWRLAGTQTTGVLIPGKK